MKLYKAIIIEDEKLARNRLKKLLLPYSNQIIVTHEADNGEDGYRLVNEQKPDLIFLDIQMPVLSGFEMLQMLTNQPKIIFTTAYEEYAIRAFEENSLDYLLKPIRPERLEITINKLDSIPRQQLPSHDTKKIMEILEKLKPRKALDAITLSTGDRILLIRKEDIVLFHAEEKYTVIYHTDGKKYLFNQSLNTLEEKLTDEFMRVHRSYIINYHYIKEIRKGFNGKLVFEMADKDRTIVTTGSSYTSKVKEILKF